MTWIITSYSGVKQNFISAQVQVNGQMYLSKENFTCPKE